MTPWCSTAEILLGQVHVSGAGDFQLSKLEVLRDPCPLNRRKGDELMDSDDIDSTQVFLFLTR